MTEQRPSKDLSSRLLAACVGGCSCLIKSPDIQYHDKYCHYRLHMEAWRALSAAREPSPDEWAAMVRRVLLNGPSDPLERIDEAVGILDRAAQPPGDGQ